MTGAAIHSPESDLARKKLMKTYTYEDGLYRKINRANQTQDKELA